MFQSQAELLSKTKPTIGLFPRLALLTLATLAATGCLPGRPGWSGAEPSIAKVDATNYSLDPAAHSKDFVLLLVKVKNPCLSQVKGFIACVADHGEHDGPLEHPFNLAAGKDNLFTFPFDRPKSFDYSVRCRLRFGELDNGAIRKPSPWVKVAVTAPQPQPQHRRASSLAARQLRTNSQTKTVTPTSER